MCIRRECKDLLEYNQKDIIDSISKKEGLKQSVVKSVFRSAEDMIKEYLETSPPEEEIIIRPVAGLSISRKYSPSRPFNKGMFKDHLTQAKVKVSADITKHFNKNINSCLFRGL